MSEKRSIFSLFINKDTLNINALGPKSLKQCDPTLKEVFTLTLKMFSQHIRPRHCFQDGDHAGEILI